MGELLGDEIKRVTGLEAALLITSAYFHDIGMVFNEDERKGLAKEQHFKTFLETHPEASITLHRQRGALSEDLAEWYCRWIHAERVSLYLSRIRVRCRERGTC